MLIWDFYRGNNRLLLAVQFVKNGTKIVDEKSINIIVSYGDRRGHQANIVNLPTLRRKLTVLLLAKKSGYDHPSSQYQITYIMRCLFLFIPSSSLTLLPAERRSMGYLFVFPSSL